MHVINFLSLEIGLHVHVDVLKTICKLEQHFTKSAYLVDDCYDDDDEWRCPSPLQYAHQY